VTLKFKVNSCLFFLAVDNDFSFSGANEVGWRQQWKPPSKTLSEHKQDITVFDLTWRFSTLIHPLLRQPVIFSPRGLSAHSLPISHKTAEALLDQHRNFASVTSKRLQQNTNPEAHNTSLTTIISLSSDNFLTPL